MKNYTLITDGAYSPANDQGGIGLVYLKDGKKVFEYSKMFKGVTNNIMELWAVIVGLKLIQKPLDSLIIVTDSMYVIGCASKGWKRKKNVRLWNEFDSELERIKALCPNIKFQHVKGHNGNEWNEYCDKLAVSASKRI